MYDLLSLDIDSDTICRNKFTTKLVHVVEIFFSDIDNCWKIEYYEIDDEKHYRLNISVESFLEQYDVYKTEDSLDGIQ